MSNSIWEVIILNYQQVKKCTHSLLFVCLICQKCKMSHHILLEMTWHKLYHILHVKNCKLKRRNIEFFSIIGYTVRCLTFFIIKQLANIKGFATSTSARFLSTLKRMMHSGIIIFSHKISGLTPNCRCKMGCDSCFVLTIQCKDNFKEDLGWVSTKI